MTTTPTPELKPCPFCGGEAWLHGPTLPMIADCDDVQVSCVDCDANGPAILFDRNVHGNTDLPDLEDEAIEAWNTRTAPTPEPVAWMQRWKTLASCPETVQLGLIKPAPIHGVTVTPLYARPHEVEALVERELAMTALANSEASSEWIDGFEHAWKRVRAALAQMGEG